ncbi:MAG: adenosyl-hopene transferase HpnH, partial [Verrucomicrobiales bacterium]|nr:adenosyl-hopene transferase HpnH [Verrucomicrobiales bacterium]MDR1304913.1 adenosyl-hopene transferase HpnH [Verrucomicrobiales bacterium]
TSNTTLFAGADPAQVRAFFDELVNIGVEGMMLSPGYSYQKAPDQDHFLHTDKTKQLFRAILQDRKKSWHFNLSPNFLEFLQGNVDYACTPWGSPAYNIFGWQKPCYLLADGYVPTFKRLIEETDWSKIGNKSADPRCRDCMVHCGFEPSSVDDTFGSLSGFIRTVKATMKYGA